MADFIENFKRYCGAPSLAGLIGVNVAVWAVVGLASLLCRLAGCDDYSWSRDMLALSSQPMTVATHPWTAVTYMVTQYSLLHMLFNMLWLFWFGRLALTLLTSRRLMWLYVGGGLTGAAAYIIVSLAGLPAAGAYLVGSSAAVMAVMTGAAFMTPELNVNLFLIGEVRLKWLALVCVAITFFGSASSTTAGSAAHIGGIVFGAAYALHLKGFFRRIASRGGQDRRQRKPRNVRRDGKAVALAAKNLSDTGRLDALLDKIRVSGYASLSEGERNELTILSQRLNKDS